MPEFKYEINKKLAVLSEKGNYTCEANVITYGDNGKPKLDIRKWNRAEDKMQKGITLTRDEALALYDALKEFDFEQLG